MDDRALREFAANVEQVEAEPKVPFELPEPDLRLDTASRGADLKRIASHIHQSSAVHAEHFRRANFVKVAYFGRFFLTEVAAGSPIGVTAAARGLVELDAFLRRVQRQLKSIADGPPQEWRSRGQAFFDVVIRARFGSSDPAVIRVLEQAGVPPKLRQPYRTGECVKMLQQSDPTHFSWLVAHYDFLCDWVHANQSSQTVSTSGARIGDSVSLGGGKMLLTGPTPIIRHEYPSKIAFEHVIDRVLQRARENFADALAAIRDTPDTPFTEEEMIRLTGTALGAPHIPPGSVAN